MLYSLIHYAQCRHSLVLICGDGDRCCGDGDRSDGDGVGMGQRLWGWVQCLRGRVGWGSVSVPVQTSSLGGTPCIDGVGMVSGIQAMC